MPDSLCVSGFSLFKGGDEMLKRIFKDERGIVVAPEYLLVLVMGLAIAAIIVFQLTPTVTDLNTKAS